MTSVDDRARGGGDGRKGALAPGQRLNDVAAHIFTECADVLRLQKANPFRVNAYVRAARALRAMPEDVRDILDDAGIEGLVRLPGIGKGLAAAIDEIARTGRLSRP